MNDLECLLVELHNENNSIAVGFRNWLDSPLTGDNLGDIIENKQTVVINWPDCNVEQASKMAKKAGICNWKKCVATILASGGWIEMNEKANNLLNFNVLQSTKSTRKLLKRKDFNSNFYYEKENKGKVSAKKNPKKSMQAVHGKIDSNQDKFLKELELAKSRKIHMSDDETSDSSSTSEKSAQQDRVALMLIKMQKLEEENKKMRSLLKKEESRKSGNDFRPSLLSSNYDQRNEKALTSSPISEPGIGSNNDHSSNNNPSSDTVPPGTGDTGSLFPSQDNGNEQADDLNPAVKAGPNNDIGNSNDNPSPDAVPPATGDTGSLSSSQNNGNKQADNLNPAVEPGSSNDIGNSNNIHDDGLGQQFIPAELQEITHEALSTQDTVLIDVTTNFEEHYEHHGEITNGSRTDLVLDASLPVVNQSEIRPQQQIIVIGQKRPQKQTGRHREKIITIGGRECSYNRIACCNRNSVSKFTVELATIVFDKEELCESSLSGKIPNFHKKNPNIIAKKQLCPIRVRGMLDQKKGMSTNESAKSKR